MNIDGYSNRQFPIQTVKKLLVVVIFLILMAVQIRTCLIMETFACYIVVVK